MFDWIPTVGEVFRKVKCTLLEHDWTGVFDRDGRILYIECKNCGKKI